MRTNLLILSAICIILFAITAQAELPTTEWKGLSLAKSNSPKPFPNLSEKNDYFPAGHLNNKIWDKIKRTTKRTWNGQVLYVIEKVTGTGRSNVFIWTGVHSFFDAITDAKTHSRGNMKYFSGDGDWHMWKNCRDVSATMLTLNFAKRIFVEKITAKEATLDLLGMGLLRYVINNSVMKISKGGFPAYNDPFYNQHALPYWGLDGKDHYIATGRTTTPLFDGLAITAFIFTAKWKF